MKTIYLSLSAQVAEGTFFRNSPVFEAYWINKLYKSIKYDLMGEGGGGDTALIIS